MSLVDVSEVSASLFITGAVFILLIFSLLSLGILRMFQLRYKAGWLSFAGAVVSSVVFGLILDRWFM
ncbi:hypothetical protein DNH61_22515 [Paenibacillus sambharensis]|uniref:Uncharacterized protein n=1 Tax=Paenibacillus sambharensis TaxID=1803190 RepID=A0A2W1LPS2_9BACL|nr:hypothetical protein [Paenibacillus sambharensis]PZD93407.1 hypothetical protein DNH61_22515 [Paenibacillus sambharensis]